VSGGHIGADRPALTAGEQRIKKDLADGFSSFAFTIHQGLPH
jgi:hypothetical protein